MANKMQIIMYERETLKRGLRFHLTYASRAITKKLVILTKIKLRKKMIVFACLSKYITPNNRVNSKNLRHSNVSTFSSII